MKNANRFVQLFFLAIIISLSGCSDEKESEQARVTRLLTTGGTWNVQSVTADGVDQSSSYTGLALAFTASSINVTNPKGAWPSSDTWKFQGGSSSMIVRGDGVVIDIKTITEKKLELGLTWNKTTFGSGRVSSVSGNHTFVFGR